MSVCTAFENAKQQMKEKRWDYIYVAVDIHGTVFKPCYEKTETYEYYPGAKETLQMLSNSLKIKLIIWSAAKPEQLEKYRKKFLSDGIIFEYCNCNPEVVDTNIASFKEKFYFNVGLDDKFGFDPKYDWKNIATWLVCNGFSEKQLLSYPLL